ncbi:MAG: hypothetical protein Q9195_008010 [Heterodermia aff. obscurata]
MLFVMYLSLIWSGARILQAAAAPVPPDPNPDTSNQVSWQSAFWALVPIALNSMTQPSGKVLGMSSRYGFYFNTSPIVCTFNALELVFKLVWRKHSMRSLAAAAQSMAEEVSEDVDGSHSRLAQLQENKTMRLIGFVIGPLPQVIKLYAMRGIPGTQICASLFFGSFLVIEAIMTLLNQHRHTTHPLGGEVTDLNDFILILQKLALCTGYASPLSLILTTSWTRQATAVELCFFFFLMGAFSFFVRPVYNVDGRVFFSRSDFSNGEIVFQALMVSPCIHSFWVAGSFGLGPLSVPEWLTILLAMFLISAYIALFLAPELDAPEENSSHSVKKPSNQQTAPPSKDLLLLNPPKKKEFQQAQSHDNTTDPQPGMKEKPKNEPRKPKQGHPTFTKLCPLSQYGRKNECLSTNSHEALGANFHAD